MQKWFYRFFIELTNHRLSSIILKKFSQSKLSAILIPSYVRIYKINQAEMEKELNEMRTLQELFTRKLKKDQRVINHETLSVISPVDGVIAETGQISQAKEIIVKDKHYSIAEMLGDNDLLTKYIGGDFIIIYLSPSHYHRIHSPISGVITKQWVLGKKSYPVNTLGLKHGKSPLSKNYRKITEIKVDDAHIAIVKVGAMFVNSIETTHTSEHLTKGEEMAYFSFGSTVILLFEKDKLRLNPISKADPHIRVGEVLGYLRD
ncbi:phosphatidylserine decarboxylase [Fredinandcohnia quinoae]|uniref:Phosphatidylserine decarboxylase proenzyme n=1 Tax=Fredinandcohnia quinoae TaxID=2918902 RepID=A0AAW5E5X8_9BACI|nr:phosphatidylserine decarboxylase [Fredinandcohnia sp. SECRCQ15]MCH1625015.1 phosphatidylserine decarboxylase [Fredinandcohnia sp. SECRCQ15]